MTSETSELLNSWEVFADVGSALVIVGVIGEGLEFALKFIKRGRKHLEEWYERNDIEIEFTGWVFWGMVVIGLMMEWRGNHKSSSIKNDEIVELTKQLDATTKKAGDAIERAAKLEKQTEDLRNVNLILEKQIRDQGYSLYDRRIKSSKAWALNLSSFTNVVVEILWQAPHGETFEVAEGVEAMIKAAGANILPWVQTNNLSGPVRIVVLVPPSSTDWPKLATAALALQKELDENGIPCTATAQTRSGIVSRIRIEIPDKGDPESVKRWRTAAKRQIDARELGLTPEPR